MKTLLAFVLLCSSAFAATATREDFAPQAPVVIVKPSGVQVPYGAGASTDLARGDALLAAVAAAVADDVIRFGPGTFDTGTDQMDLPDDVSLIGDGTQTTWIVNTRDASANGCTIVPGDNAELAYFSFDTTAERLAKPIGSVDNLTANDKCFEGVFIHHIHFETQIDGVHIVNGPSAADNGVFSFRVENCTSHGAWDFVAVSSISEATIVTAELRNNKAVCVGNLYSAEETSRPFAISDSGSGTITANIYGDTYEVSGGSAYNRGVYCYGDGASVVLHDVAISTSGTGAADLVQASSGTITVIGGKGSGTNGAYTTSGTITFSDGGTIVDSLDAVSSGAYTKRVAQVQLSDPNGSAIATGDGIGGFQYRVPSVLNGWNLVGVGASVTTASSSGVVTVQVANATDSTDMLSTAITIDANETDTATAATAAVVNTSYDDVATADKIRFDVDGAGTGTKGLSVTLIFQAP